MLALLLLLSLLAIHPVTALVDPTAPLDVAWEALEIAAIGTMQARSDDECNRDTLPILTCNARRPGRPISGCDRF